MDLSAKAIRFLVEALRCQEEFYDRRMRDGNLSEDDLSDLANDRQYLLNVREYLQEQHDELLKESDSLAAKV